jgi:septation ring formation regulator EzrA
VSLEQVFMVGLSVGFAVLGWFARELWTAVQSLRTDLGRLEVRMSNEYVRYDRLQDALKPITVALEDIKSALMHKADK